MATEFQTAPDWLRSVEAEEKAESAAKELATAQLTSATLRVEADAPTVLQDLLRELTVCIKALDSGSRSGSVTTWGSLEYEQGCRVSVQRTNCVLPRLTYTTLNYQKVGHRISCNTSEGKAFLLWFCVYDNRVCIQANDAPAPMDYKQAAQFLLKPMLALTKRP